MVVLSALDLFAAWGSHESAVHAFTLEYGLRRLPRSAYEVIIPSVVLSMIALGIRMARKPFSRLLGFAIALGASYLVLVNGMLWLGMLNSQPRAVEAAPWHPIKPAILTRIDAAYLSAQSVQGEMLQGVLVFDPSRLEKRFSVFSEGRVTATEPMLSVRMAGARTAEIAGSAGTSFGAVFAPDRFTAIFLRDIHVLTRDFEALASRSLAQFFVACFSLLLLCAASMVFLRISRWPMLNVLLLALAVRGYFLLYHALAVDLAPQIGKAISDPLVARLSPSLAMAALAIVLLLIDILFIPADRWAQAEAA